MCHSQGLSLFLSVIGRIITAYYLNKKSIKGIIFGFYSVMETTQLIQSFVLDKCENNTNYYSTIFAMFLVSVQPMLWNWYRIRNNKKHKEVFTFAFWASFIWAIGYFIRLVRTDEENLPMFNHEINVGEVFCTYKGESHLFWQFPLNRFSGFEANMFPYLMLWFLPCLWEDSHGFIKLILWILQTQVAKYTSTEIDEYSSVWCLYSVPVLILMCFRLY